MKITFCGAAGEVTGSQHLIECGKLKILLDCGLFQGHRAGGAGLGCASAAPVAMASASSARAGVRVIPGELMSSPFGQR